MADDNALVDLSTLDLPVLISIAARLVNEQVLARLRTAGYDGVRESDGYLVQHLIGGPQTPSALAARLGISQQAASKRVREIEERGYVERVPDPADRRQTLTRLTSRGVGMVSRTREIRAELEAEFGGLGIDIAGVRHGLVAVVEGVDRAQSYRKRQVREGD